jgi:hypothetical protein
MSLLRLTIVRTVAAAFAVGTVVRPGAAPLAGTTLAPVPVVTNPYFPLVPGTTFRIRGTGESRDETVIVVSTARGCDGA